MEVVVMKTLRLKFHRARTTMKIPRRTSRRVIPNQTLSKPCFSYRKGLKQNGGVFVVGRHRKTEKSRKRKHLSRKKLVLKDTRGNCGTFSVAKRSVPPGGKIGCKRNRN